MNVLKWHAGLAAGLIALASLFHTLRARIELWVSVAAAIVLAWIMPPLPWEVVAWGHHQLPRDVFRADTMWGLAALALLITGVIRAFGGFEKGGSYYLHEPLFHLKMTALVLILFIEISPMMALMRTTSSLKRCLAPAATGTPSTRANAAASFALPRSGDTTTDWLRSPLQKC